MKKILVSTTYSDNPLNTWIYALKLASYHDAEITLLTVDGSGDLNRESFNLNTPKQFEALSIKYIFRQGDVAESILEEERDNDYDLVMIGTRKRKSITDLLFGNITEELMEKSRTTMMIIPTTAQYQGMNKVVYISDFLFEDRSAIAELGGWIRVFKASLDLVHIYKEEADFKVVMNHMESIKFDYMDEIESQTYFFKLIKNDPSKNINEYIQMHKTNMIAMTHRKKGFLSRILNPDFTERVSHGALIPVLVFKG